MSVIDIEKSKINSNNIGITKTIDENALTLILDNVQISQYVYPEQSTVRELTSNAVDSQKEKEKVIEILTGKARVEDYYIKRDNAKYNDSNFDKSYYDLKYLDSKHNRVELTYIVGVEGVGWCDKFVVKDYGVGLGDKRLFGYFSIGYSTKRNMVSQFGGFGIGAKVGLSLRNDYFTTETVHNGRRFKFNCYSYKVDSLIGKFNDKGEKNKFIISPEGLTIYYEDTTELNYTQVIVPCKSHHKEKFKHGVEAQLLYFDNVDFTIIEKDGTKNKKDIQARILYNSDNLIIADQHQYSKPHVVVVKDKTSNVGVAYGYINFREMEMQDLFGNVGFKCPIRQVIRDKSGNEQIIQEGIEVSPSRESVVFSDVTREYVKKAIEIATKEANVIVEKQLKEEDILIWIEKAKNVLGNMGGYGTNPTLKHLASIIDKTQLSPTYILDDNIRYGIFMFWGLNVRTIKKIWNNKDRQDDIDREEVKELFQFNPQQCYLQIGNSQVNKDFYLNHTQGVFNTIRIEDDEKILSYIKQTEIDEATGKPKANKWTLDYVNKLKDKRNRFIEYLKKSKLFKSYDDVIVPEDWNKKFEERGQVSADGEKIEKLTPLELRKLAEQTIVHTLVYDPYRKDNKPYKWSKREIKIGDLKDSTDRIYYNYGDNEELEYTTILLHQMRGGKNDEKLTFYRVSKSMPKKFLRKHKHLNQFYQIETEKYRGMANELVQWTTAKLIDEKLSELKFMRNYNLFNQEISQLYKEVKEYKEKNYNPAYKDYISKYEKSDDFMKKTFEYTSKVTKLQLFIRDHKDKPEEIQRKSLELFGINTIESSVGYNLEMYDKLQILLNYSEPVKDLFNHIDLLTDIKNPSISSETEYLIKEIIEAKGLSSFEIPEIKVDEIIEEVEDEIIVKEEETVEDNNPVF